MACAIVWGLLAPASAGQAETPRGSGTLDLARQLREAYVSPHAGPPAIALVDCPGSVGQYEKFEVRFLVEAGYQNPFDPDDIEVNGLITTPDGREINLAAFYYIPYEPLNGLTQLSGGARFRRSGTPCWMLRFAASQLGRHRFCLRVRDSRGRRAQSESRDFAVTPTARKGFVEVSPGNPHYFQYSADASLFFACGSNVAWTRTNERVAQTPSYEYYFGRAEGQVTASRVWMCHWAWLEWMPRESDDVWYGYAGLGYYNPMVATSFDRLFRLAEDADIRLMLTLEDNNEQSVDGGPDSWTFHPYNRANGGVCDAPSEYFKNADVRRWYQKRLRYILARWGYSTSLWALNGWNDYQQPDGDVLEFLKDTRDYVHRALSAWRPAIYGANFRWEANRVSDYAQATTALAKPGVVQECYFVDDRRWFRPVLQSELWNALARGLAGVMVWDHVLVDNTNAWRDFSALQTFTADLELNKGTWRKLAVRAVSATSASLPRRVVSLEPYGDVPGWQARATQSEFAVELAANRQWVEGLGPTLYGDRATHRAWRNPPTFAVTMPSAGRFVVEVDEIGGGRSALGVTIDGVLAHRATFENGRRTLHGSEQIVEVPVPAGRHRIAIDNVQKGGDWIRFRRCHVVVDSASPADVIVSEGLSSGDRGFLYLENPTFGPFYADVLHEPGTPLEDVVLEVSGLEDGSYLVARHRTTDGLPMGSPTRAECRGGRLVLAVGQLERSLALKLTRP